MLLVKRSVEGTLGLQKKIRLSRLKIEFLKSIQIRIKDIIAYNILILQIINFNFYF